MKILHPFFCNLFILAPFFNSVAKFILQKKRENYVFIKIESGSEEEVQSKGILLWYLEDGI